MSQRNNITLTSAALLLEAASWVVTVAMLLVVTAADLLVDVNLSLLTGVVTVTPPAVDVELVAVVTVGGVTLFPFTEAACA